jgi:hypothetical protein
LERVRSLLDDGEPGSLPPAPRPAAIVSG